MKTKYKHIKFTKTTLVGHWNCFNVKSGDSLGSVFYDKQCSQYIFEPDEFGEYAFTSSCLRDMAHFLDQLNEQRKRPPQTNLKRTQNSAKQLAATVRPRRAVQKGQEMI